MFTKENLETIIKLSDLEKGIEGKDEYLALIASLEKDIHIAVGSNEIFNISYEDNNPMIARNVVYAILAPFATSYDPVIDDEKNATVSRCPN
jgi:hypothetical protein